MLRRERFSPPALRQAKLLGCAANSTEPETSGCTGLRNGGICPRLLPSCLCLSLLLLLSFIPDYSAPPELQVAGPYADGRSQGAYLKLTVIAVTPTARGPLRGRDLPAAGAFAFFQAATAEKIHRIKKKKNTVWQFPCLGFRKDTPFPSRKHSNCHQRKQQVSSRLGCNQVSGCTKNQQFPVHTQLVLHK